MVVKYLPRILDKDLEKYLTIIGAISLLDRNGVAKQLLPNSMLKVY